MRGTEKCGRLHYTISRRNAAAENIAHVVHNVAASRLYGGHTNVQGTPVAEIRSLSCDEGCRFNYWLCSTATRRICSLQESSRTYGSDAKRRT